MSIKDKLKDFISPDDDELYLDEDEVESISSKYEEPRSKTAANAHIEAKMVLFEPRAFSDVKEVANRLKEEKAAVINLHRLDHISARRTSDFLSGVMKALDGTIQRIGTLVLLCTPNSIQVKGKIDVDGKDEE